MRVEAAAEGHCFTGREYHGLDARSSFYGRTVQLPKKHCHSRAVLVCFAAMAAIARFTDKAITSGDRPERDAVVEAACHD
jgi:hypothetical protein